MYENKQHILEELKQNIYLCLSTITEKTLQGVAANMRKKVNTSIPEIGGYSSTKHNTVLVLIVLYFFLTEHFQRNRL